MLARTRLLAAAVVLSGLVPALVACSTEVIEKPADPAAPGGTATDTDPTTPGQSKIAGTVSVDGISLYQGVEVRLVKEGAAVEKRNAPVITNRPALVRVRAAKDPSVRVGKVTAKLHVKIDGEEKVLTDGPKTLQAFDDTSLDTTFNFQLEAEQMTTDMEMSVELVGAAGNEDKVTFPADDTTLSLGAQDAAKLRVELIPVKYAADGSNRLPVLDDANVKRYHDALYQMYPVSEVEITQHSVLPWEVPIEPTGAGWDQLLNAVMMMRSDASVDEDVYYIGVFNPAASIREYCGHGGCVLGIAPATGLGMDIDARMELRSALVVGYQTQRSGGTISQELAHAMGRLHAPCGNPAAIDKKYPYKEAQIGSTGWDVLSRELVSSDDHADFMSYCDPVWVSDYTYKAIFDRMSRVRDTIASRQGQRSTKGLVAGGTSLPTSPNQAFRLPALSKDQIAWTRMQP